MRKLKTFLFVIMLMLINISFAYAHTEYDSEQIASRVDTLLLRMLLFGALFCWLCEQNIKAGLCAIVGGIGTIGLLRQFHNPSLISIIIFAAMLIGGIYGFKKYEYDT